MTPVKFGFDNPVLKTWFLLHQTYNLALKIEEVAFANLGISPQQYCIIMVMRYMQGPTTVKDIANWLDRNSNTISVMLDRLEKDGLVRRSRSLKDRREVRIVITKKGKEIADQAAVLGWRAIQKILCSIPEEDLQSLVNIMETIREKSLDFLGKGHIIEEAKLTKHASDMTRSLKPSRGDISDADIVVKTDIPK